MFQKKSIRGLIYFSLSLLSMSSIAAELQSISAQDSAGKSSIVCSISGKISYKGFILSQPNRVVIDFNQTKLGFDLNKLRLNSSIVKHARSGHPNPQTLRVVFDVNQPVTVRYEMIKQRLAINIVPKGKIVAPQAVYSATKNSKTLPVDLHAKPDLKLAKKPIPVHMPPRALRDVVVVIDPGHGGKDPGAIGPRRTAEKNIVLAIALKLKQHIDRQPGMRAVLTRTGDYYIGLRQRLNIARKYNADIFVAIHADAFSNHQSTGASVFALSQRGATSEAAKWLAEKENYSELGGVNLSGLDDQNGIVRTVLIDLSQTATINASLQMGSRVLQNLDQVTNLHNNRVEQARFVVLKSPDIPSVLIETGFISNPREEMNLSNPAYQTRLTQAIFQGIKRYFWDYPPHGTRVEAMANSNRRWARAG